MEQVGVLPRLPLPDFPKQRLQITQRETPTLPPFAYRGSGKAFTFLTSALQPQNIVYRWELPFKLIINYENTKFYQENPGRQVFLERFLQKIIQYKQILRTRGEKEEKL